MDAFRDGLKMGLRVTALAPRRKGVWSQEGTLAGSTTVAAGEAKRVHFVASKYSKRMSPSEELLITVGFVSSPAATPQGLP